MPKKVKSKIIIGILFLLSVIYFSKVLIPDIREITLDEYLEMLESKKYREQWKNMEFASHIYRTFEMEKDGFPVHEYPIIFNTITKRLEQKKPFNIYIDEKNNLTNDINYYIIEFPMMGGPQSDYTISAYHWDKFLAEGILRDGQIPMWNQYQFCGHPTVSAGGYSLFPGTIVLFPFLFVLKIILIMFINIKICRIDLFRTYFLISAVINFTLAIVGTFFLLLPSIPNNFFFNILKLNSFGGVYCGMINMLMIIALEDNFNEK